MIRTRSDVIVCGIDPGQNGAIAAIGPEGYDVIPFTKRTERDIYSAFSEVVEIVHSSQNARDCFVWLEKVHAMPRQGVSSVFRFGANYGLLRGFLIAGGYSFQEVTPNTWQKSLGCQSKGDKNVTKAKAQQLFPECKMTHAKADALLIAEYGRRIGGY